MILRSVESFPIWVDRKIGLNGNSRLAKELATDAVFESRLRELINFESIQISHSGRVSRLRISKKGCCIELYNTRFPEDTEEIIERIF